jgi:hypothetical protein
MFDSQFEAARRGSKGQKMRRLWPLVLGNLEIRQMLKLKQKFSTIYEPIRVIDGVSFLIGVLATWAFAIYGGF